MGQFTYGFQPQADGAIQFVITAADGQRIEMRLLAEQVSALVAAALKAASLSGRLAPPRRASGERLDQDIAGCTPDGLGIAMGPEHEQMTLVAHYGSATLALPFTSQQAITVGQALLAAGAVPVANAN